MVRAERDDRKMMTRRIAKGVVAVHATTGEALRELDSAGPRVTCPCGQSGDRLRVKEAAWMWCERVPNGTTSTGRKKWHYLPLREAPVIY